VTKMTTEYTVSLTVTSSNFPNHPHLAVLVAKRMWEMSHLPDSISSLTGIPMTTIRQLSRIQKWERLPKSVWITGYHGPFLLPDEMDELYNGQRLEDDPAAPQREAVYRGGWVQDRSAPSALDWL